jgi:hypothetical protein
MKHSTGRMTVADSAYVEACKTWECVACSIREKSEDCPPFFVPFMGCDFHHFKSGNVRIGHLWGVGLCAWHHRGIGIEGWTPAAMRRHFGPSLMDGSQTFHKAYGYDPDLLEAQDAILALYGATPPQRPENRRWAA